MNNEENSPKRISLAAPTLIFDVLIPALIVLLWIFGEHIHYPLGESVSVTILLILMLVLLNHSYFLERRHRDPVWIEKQKILLEEQMSRYRNWNLNEHGGCYPLALTFKKMFLGTAALTTLVSLILFIIFWGNIETFFKIAVVAPFAMWCIPTMFIFLPCAKIYNGVFKDEIRKIKELRELINYFFKDEILSDESVGEDPYRKDIYQAYQMMLRYTKYWMCVFIVAWLSLIVICFLRMKQ